MALRDLWTPSQDLKEKKVKKLNNDKFYRSRLDLVSYNFLLYLQLLRKLLNANANIQRPLLLKYVFNFKKNVSS